MTSKARVNGLEHVSTVTVYCADTIALFNNDLVRQGMLATLDSSGVFTATLNSRTERVFFVLLDTVAAGATPYVAIQPKLPKADVCQVGDSIPHFSSRPPNTKVLAWGHDHMGESGQLIWCKDEQGQYEMDPNGNPIFSEIALGVTIDDWRLQIGEISHRVLTM